MPRDIVHASIMVTGIALSKVTVNKVNLSVSLFDQISMVSRQITTKFLWKNLTSSSWEPIILKMSNTTRVEVPEIISAEQRCFRDLTFFSADSENMKNVSADQLFQSWWLLILSESALFRTEKFTRCFRENQRWFTLTQLGYFHM